ncbi:MAG: hypothetical protein ACI936_001137 [Paraglaciecola sp.]|jgi:hypothetical protein
MFFECPRQGTLKFRRSQSCVNIVILMLLEPAEYPHNVPYKQSRCAVAELKLEATPHTSMDQPSHFQ